MSFEDRKERPRGFFRRSFDKLFRGFPRRHDRNGRGPKQTFVETDEFDATACCGCWAGIGLCLRIFWNGFISRTRRKSNDSNNNHFDVFTVYKGEMPHAADLCYTTDDVCSTPSTFSADLLPKDPINDVLSHTASIQKTSLGQPTLNHLTTLDASFLKDILHSESLNSVCIEQKNDFADHKFPPPPPPPPPNTFNSPTAKRPKKRRVTPAVVHNSRLPDCQKPSQALPDDCILDYAITTPANPDQTRASTERNSSPMPVTPPQVPRFSGPRVLPVLPATDFSNDLDEDDTRWARPVTDVSNDLDDDDTRWAKPVTVNVAKKSHKPCHASSLSHATTQKLLTEGTKRNHSSAKDIVGQKSHKACHASSLNIDDTRWARPVTVNVAKKSHKPRHTSSLSHATTQKLLTEVTKRNHSSAKDIVGPVNVAKKSHKACHASSLPHASTQKSSTKARSRLGSQSTATRCKSTSVVTEVRELYKDTKEKGAPVTDLASQGAPDGSVVNCAEAERSGNVIQNDMALINIEIYGNESIDEWKINSNGTYDEIHEVHFAAETNLVKKEPSPSKKTKGRPVTSKRNGPNVMQVNNWANKSPLKKRNCEPVLHIPYSNPPMIKPLGRKDREHLIRLLSKYDSPCPTSVSWNDALLCGNDLQFATYKNSCRTIRLGGGAFGDVFLGLLHGKTPVAVKLFLKEYSSVEDITSECHILYHLSSTNATPAFLGVCNTLYNDKYHRAGLVMEYIADPRLKKTRSRFGDTVRSDEVSIVTNGKPCLIKRRDWKIMPLHLARTLSWIHERGIILNDIKCDNVLLQYDHVRGRWQPIYIDLGLACKNKNKGGIHVATDERDEYRRKFPQIAPEKIKGKPLTVKTDVYSLGMLFDKLDKAFKLSIHDVVARCLSEDPECRPTAAELVEILREKEPEDHG